jgi:hypothetical protein
MLQMMSFSVRRLYDEAYRSLCELAGVREPCLLAHEPRHRGRYDERRARATAYLMERGIHALHSDFRRTPAADTNITVVWARAGFDVAIERVNWMFFPGPRVPATMRGKGVQS